MLNPPFSPFFDLSSQWDPRPAGCATPFSARDPRAFPLAGASKEHERLHRKIHDDAAGKRISWWLRQRDKSNASWLWEWDKSHMVGGWCWKKNIKKLFVWVWVDERENRKNE